MTLTINNTTYEPTISSESTIVCMGCDLLSMCEHKICDAIDNETYTQYKKSKNMTIETKYSIGDEVWFMFDGKPLNGKVSRISEHTIKIKVVFKDGKEYLFSRDIKDFKLFHTKEELLKSL